MDPTTTAATGRLRWWPYLVATLAFIAYVAWIGGPYLRSIVVRDAAVTAWSNVATAPLTGTVRFAPIRIGERIGEDGLIAELRNDHSSRVGVDDAALEVALAEAELAHAHDLLAEVEALEADRRATKSHYADIFRAQLDVRIAHFRSRIALQEKRLEVMRAISERKRRLAATGTGSINEADEVSLRMSEMTVDIEEMRSDLSHAERRRRAADEGIFIQENGDDPNWVLNSRMELKVEKKKARHAVNEAEIRLATARARLKRAQADFDRLSTGRVEGPPGRLLWRRHAVSGMTVAEGAPVAEHIDCDRVLVDMPVSDAEVALVHPGDPAEVVFEGEKRVRAAEVLMVRGSASVLGRDELAALAKGRSGSLGQVLLAVDADGESFPTCPVGRAAHVDLPGVGVIDVIRARLRF